MFFVPYSTDAPVYHWPYATVGLIVVNVGVFIGAFAGVLAEPNSWVLKYGELDPTQWVLSAFMHAGPGHLIGNMVFLWVFGIVVEGKLGAPRFLACYLSIAVVESGLEQLLFLGYSGDPSGSLGASTAIYGIMAMAAVWAPRNEITCFYFFLIFFYPIVGTVEVPIAVLCLAYLGLDLLGILLGGGSGWLHFAGAILGFPLGIALLKSGIVDCEGWDMFHVWRGDYGGKESQAKKDAQAMEAHKQKTEVRKTQIIDGAHVQLGLYLQNGNGLAALKLLDKLREDNHEIELDEEELGKLIPLMHQAGKWRESAPYMAQLLQLRGDLNSDPLRLKLAQICVVELERPGRALDLLGEIDAKRLEPQAMKLAKKIAAKAKQQQAEGVVEIDDGNW